MSTELSWCLRRSSVASFAEVIVGDAAALCGEYGRFDRIVLERALHRARDIAPAPEIGQRRRLKGLRAHSKTKDACFKPRSTFCSRAEAWCIRSVVSSPKRAKR